jgi:hypothetical protein
MPIINTTVKNKNRPTKKQTDAYMGFPSVQREDVTIARFPEECINI